MELNGVEKDCTRSSHNKKNNFPTFCTAEKESQLPDVLVGSVVLKQSLIEKLSNSKCKASSSSTLDPARHDTARHTAPDLV